MAITHTQLIDGTQVASPGASTVTGSVTTTGYALQVLFVSSMHSGGTAASPTSVTSSGMTWVMQDQLITGARCISMWYTQDSAAHTGAITITWAAGTTTAIYRLDEYPGVLIDLTGHGAAAIAQEAATGLSDASPTITMTNNLAANSVLIGGMTEDNITTSITAGTNFTKLGTDATNGVATTMSAEWFATPTATQKTVNFSLGATRNWMIIGAEIKVAADPTNVGGVATGEALGQTAVSQPGVIAAVGGVASAEALGQSILSGTGALPTLVLEAAFPNSVGDATPTWSDLSADVRHLSTHRGRSNELDRFQPGTMAATLDNRAGRYDPTNTTSPYWDSANARSYVRPRKRLRFRAAYAGVIYRVIDVYADVWYQDYVKPRDALCQLSATDLFKILATKTLPSPWEYQVRNPASGGGVATHWLRLDEKATTGSVLDAIASTKGSFVGTPTVNVSSLIIGDNDTAMTFDGTSAGIHFASSPLTSGAFSIITWLTLPVVAAGTVWKHIGPFWSAELLVDGSSKMRFKVINSVGVGEMQDSAVLVAGQTYCFTCTFDDNVTPHIWRDFGSTESLTSGLGGAGTFGAGTFDVGGDGTAFYNVTVDDIVFLDRVISQADAENYYYSGGAAGTYVVSSTSLMQRIMRYAGLGSSFYSAPGSHPVYVPEDKFDSPQDRKALDYLNDLMVTERGAFYVNQSGQATWQDHTRVLTPKLGDPQAVFGSGGGTQIPYTTIGFDWSDQPIISEVRVANAWVKVAASGAGSLQTEHTVVTNTASMTEFEGPSLDLNIKATGSGTSASLRTLATAQQAMLDRANYELDQYAQPFLRLPQLVVEPQANAAVLWPLILKLELMDRVQVNHVTPDGRTITRNLTISGIEHQVSAGRWVVTFTVDAGGRQGHDFWILGTAGYSELGVTTYLGF